MADYDHDSDGKCLPHSVRIAQPAARLAHLKKKVYKTGADREVETYISQQDEAVFEALVRRHGLMVLKACRRGIHPFLADEVS